MSDRTHTEGYYQEQEAILEGEYAPLAVREEPAAVAIMPAVTPAEARAAMEQYQAVCEAVLTPDDYQTFRERGKEKRFKKKSAVKKLQTFWSVSVTVRDVVRDDLGDGHFGFRCIAVASMPSGRTVESTGGCSTFEERFDIKPYDNEKPQQFAERAKKARARSYHDVMSTAETRATNRAVMNCIGVGGGEVTADEVQRPKDPPQPPPAKKDHPLSKENLIKRHAEVGAPLGDLATFATDVLCKPMKGVAPTIAERRLLMKALAEHAAAVQGAADHAGNMPDPPYRGPEDRGKPDEYDEFPFEPEEPADPVSTDPRERALKRHHILAKERNMPDDVRKRILRNLAGKESSRDCTFAQLVLVNGEIERWNP